MVSELSGAGTERAMFGDFTNLFPIFLFLTSVCVCYSRPDFAIHLRDILECCGNILLADVGGWDLCGVDNYIWYTV